MTHSLVNLNSKEQFYVFLVCLSKNSLSWGAALVKRSLKCAGVAMCLADGIIAPGSNA